MIIYKITNKVNNKCYIGQTRNTFTRRYGGIKWWNTTSNQCLYYAVQKHGLENFTVEFLHENVESLDKLNELEAMYIKQFNSLAPNGYNFTEGGDSKNTKHSNDDRDRNALAVSGGKIRRLKNIKTGEIFEFVNVTRFCEEHNIKYPANILALWRLNRSRFGDWIKAETVLKEYKLIDPNGQKFSFYHWGRAQFCREHDLNSGNLYELFKGTKSNVKGWIVDNEVVT